MIHLGCSSTNGMSYRLDAALLSALPTNRETDQAVVLVARSCRYRGTYHKDILRDSMRRKLASASYGPLRLMRFFPEMHKCVQKEPNTQSIQRHKNDETY